jgi:hypothetical protein
VACVFLWPAQAQAGIPILITHGDHISHIGEVSREHQPNLKVSKVGYKYSYFGIFWVNLWTWGGTHCVYEGNSYQPIPPAVAAALMGKQEGEVGVPWLYRIPLGWLIIGALVVVGIIANVREKSSASQVASPFQDPRYLKALEVMREQFAKVPAAAPAEAGPGQEAIAEANTDDDSRFRTAFEAGVQSLVEAGVAREEAERNLALMVHALSQASEQEAPGEPSPAPPA